ncbi:MAG: hypothetical protein ACREXX_11680 [Gammaproteobacteria bacterium]
MRKIFLHIMVSLDGFIEDQNHGLDWHFVDDEFEKYINGVLRSIDGMIFGRAAHSYSPNTGPQRVPIPMHRRNT